MPENVKWEGVTKGGLTGHKIFVFILRTSGIKVAYFILRFVAFYYLVTARSTRLSLKYFRKIHGYKGLKLYRACYQNYFQFGQVLIDKVVFLSGIKHKFSFEAEGHNENLEKLKASNKGAILLSAHIGNWDIAGQKLESLNTVFNVLVYDNEKTRMKEYMNSVMKQKNFNMIVIREGEMGHLVELNRAFGNKELLVMHGDRYLANNETITKIFMGFPAKFPKGPFILAVRFGVPIVIAFSMKDSKTHYHFYARPPIESPKASTREEMENAINDLSDKYVRELELILKKYPTQWFNFYDFWDIAV